MTNIVCFYEMLAVLLAFYLRIISLLIVFCIYDKILFVDTAAIC